MRLVIITIQLATALAMLCSCATSMTPSQVNSTLPPLTKSEFIPKSEVNDKINNGQCKYLIIGRNYNAPIGLSVNGDLKNAAKGIDEWVDLDEGNAYVLDNYKWVTLDEHGTTQLYVEFNTLLCEE